MRSLFYLDSIEEIEFQPMKSAKYSPVRHICRSFQLLQILAKLFP